MKIRIIIYIIILIIGIGVFIFHKNPKWSPWYCNKFSNSHSSIYKSTEECQQNGCIVKEIIKAPKKQSNTNNDSFNFGTPIIEFECVKK